MTNIGKLLYATDIKQPRFSEVERLLALRNLGLEEIVFFHMTKVEGWEKSLADYDMNSKTLMVDGPFVPGILKAAHQEAVSLIAASMNRDTGRLLHRSQTNELIRSSPVPVIILPEEETYRSGQKDIFSHVIFATDWSVISEKVLSYLLHFKEITKELEIVHVIDRKLSVRELRNLKEKLSQTRKIFLDHGIDAEAHIYAGKPSDEVKLAAEDYDATCIVMGTSCKSSLKVIFSESCSYRVAEKTIVPSLFIPLTESRANGRNKEEKTKEGINGSNVIA